MTKQNKPKKPTKSSQIAELTEDLKRIQADFVNYKRRVEAEKLSFANSGKQAVLSELLPVIDNIDRALTNTPKELKDNDFVKGVQSIAKQLNDALKKVGVEKMNTLGLEFDPESMDAVAIEEGDGKKEIVVEELQPGYIMNGYILRHAMVKVGRK